MFISILILSLYLFLVVPLSSSRFKKVPFDYSGVGLGWVVG